MTNEECRQLFIKNGLSYKDIDLSKIHKLKHMLEYELNEFHKTNTEINMRLKRTGTRGKRSEFNSDGTLIKYFIRVNGSYFTDREAISFNSDGFIGFAGWADDKNVQPMLIAFNKWVEGDLK